MSKSRRASTPAAPFPSRQACCIQQYSKPHDRINVTLLSNQSVGLSLVGGHHILKYEWPYDNDEKSPAVQQKKNKNQFDSAGKQNNEVNQMIVSSCLEDMDATVRQQKAALRKQMNQVLNALPKHEVVRQSKIVTDKIKWDQFHEWMQDGYATYRQQVLKML
uniref:Uncharacterized protein n=1 Tax=Timema tahoe TaxID=61484 RepID=A0A7R9FHI8_9NEOP|nr:unnamed protein product [Timema tahoe]